MHVEQMEKNKMHGEQMEKNKMHLGSPSADGDALKDTR